jgi:predicted RNA-binding protein
MSETMQQQIDLEVNKMRAPGGTAGMMFGRHEYEQLIRKAITNGTLIGYVHGETFTRERLERKYRDMDQEMQLLRERVKDLELEIIAATK